MAKRNIHGKIERMTEQTLLHEQYDNHVVVLTFNRPQSLNALDLITMQKFASTIDELALDDELRVLILVGAGERAFSSGADLNLPVVFCDLLTGRRQLQQTPG